MRGIFSSCGWLAALVVASVLSACSSGRGGSVELQEDPCARGSGRRECLRRAEAEQLRGAPGEVQRRGDTLLIESRSGVVTFEDSLEHDVDGASYTYAGSLGDLGFFLVEVHYRQGGGYLIVDARTGKQTPSVAIPVVSPSQLRLVATSVDLVARSRPTSVQIWRIAETGLTPEFRYNFLDTDWGPGRPRWQGDEQLRFARLDAAGNDRGDATLTLTIDGWYSEDLPRR